MNAVSCGLTSEAQLAELPGRGGVEKDGVSVNTAWPFPGCFSLVWRLGSFAVSLSPPRKHVGIIFAGVSASFNPRLVLLPRQLIVQS